MPETIKTGALDGLKYILVGDAPEDESDASVQKTEALLLRLGAALKKHCKAGYAEEPNILLDGIEFGLYSDDLMPLGLYALSPDGNSTIDKLVPLLREEFAK
jgi:hypothetical protein